MTSSPHHRPPVLDAIAQWQDRPLSEFPSASPPCDALGDSSADRVLAAAFQSVASDQDELRRMLHLNDLIQIHTTRTLGALNAQPSRYDELQTWLRMILVLSSWFMALYSVRVSA